jgi:hypothetical protein
MATFVLSSQIFSIGLAKSLKKTFLDCNSDLLDD